MMLFSNFGNTRAGIAIKAGAVVKRVHGIPTIRIEPLKAFADGQCCGIPYSTEYVSSSGASVHVWLEAGMHQDKIGEVVKALVYWKDVMVLTWSHGKPLGYHTYYRLDSREDRQQAANEKSLADVVGF